MRTRYAILSRRRQRISQGTATVRRDRLNRTDGVRLVTRAITRLRLVRGARLRNLRPHAGGPGARLPSLL